MQTILGIINHYVEKPWDLLGIPFLLIAVGATIHLFYDALRNRRAQAISRERERQVQALQAQEREIAKIVHDLQRLDKVARNLNEVRDKMGLPPTDIFDLTTK